MLEHCLVPVRFSVKIILSFVVTVPPVLHSGGGGSLNDAAVHSSVHLSVCLPHTHSSTMVHFRMLWLL